MTVCLPVRHRETSLTHVRLVSGQAAPHFRGQTVGGESFDLGQKIGVPIWLSLQRYSACPFCSWRIHRLVAEQAAIADAGLHLVCVFPSPIARVQKYTMKYRPTFTVICDPSQAIHGLYSSETSWAGEFRSAINLPRAVAALAKAPNNPLAVDGPIHRMPAEFLISPQGQIARAHYGTQLDDGIDVEVAIRWVRDVLHPASPSALLERPRWGEDDEPEFRR